MSVPRLWSGLVLIFSLLLGAGSCFGQADRARVVTLDSGVQFEGQIFTLKEISISSAAFSPYGAGTLLSS